jgi:hypothetical protein
MPATEPAKGKKEPRSETLSKAERAEISRANSRKSTGPRTPEGKDRSRFNATKHGLTARSVLLPGEDPSQLAARQQQLIDDLQPRHSAEITAIELMAGAIWRSDRSERALGSRINFRLRHEPLEQAKKEREEAIELGGRLFWQPAFPLPISKRFPVGKLTEPQCAENAFHPHHPARLRLQLEQTIPGCEWLLDRWTDLMHRLERDATWLSGDAFKMVRLMGKHAIDMADDFDVARMFLSSLTLISAPKAGPERESFDWNQALIKMLVTFDVENKNGIAATAAQQCEPFARRLAELPLARLAPRDEQQARESLSSIIHQEMGRLQETLSVLQAIADADQAEAPARLAFEIGVEGDRYRRYELTNERLALHSYDRFLRTRNFVVTGRFDLIDVDLQNLIGSVVPQVEAPDGIESADVASGAPTVASVERGTVESDAVLSTVDDCRTIAPSPEQKTTCDDDRILRNGAIMPSGNAPNEPTAMSAEWGAEGGETENPTNEPTEPENNATNEPRRAADGDDDKGMGLCASTVGGGHAYLEEVHQTEIADELFWREVEARKQIRAERLRKLNEESRLEADAARAARHSPYRQIRKKKRSHNEAIAAEHSPRLLVDERFSRYHQLF